MVFAALAVLGLLSWAAGSPGLVSRMLGLDLSFWRPAGVFADNFFFVSLVGCLLALASGLVFPRGFYLWGIALALHTPFTEALTVYLMQRDGYGLVGGAQGIASYIFITALFVFGAMLIYTAFSTLGMGLRYLVLGDRSREERQGRRGRS